MTLPTSGNISILDLKAEFGGNANPKLTDYYAGGAFVPSGTKNGLGVEIPSSGNISIRDFYGASNALISITDRNHHVTDSPEPEVGFRLGSDGVLYLNTNAVYTAVTNEWKIGNIIPSDYEVYATFVEDLNGLGAGGVSGSSFNTWLSLNFNREWYVWSNQYIDGEGFTIPGSYGGDVTIQIRKIGTATILDTATISLESRGLF